MFRPNIGILFAAPLPLFSKRARVQDFLLAQTYFALPHCVCSISRRSYERSEVERRPFHPQTHTIPTAREMLLHCVQIKFSAAASRL